MRKPTVMPALILAAVLLMAGCFSSCTGISSAGTNTYNDDTAIASQMDFHIVGSSSWTHFGDQYTMEYSSYNGTARRFSLYANGEGTLEATFDATVREGQFKFVLVTQDGKVTTIFEGTDKGTKTIQIPNGANRLKLVGSGASGRFQLSMKASDNISIMPVKN